MSKDKVFFLLGVACAALALIVVFYVSEVIFDRLSWDWGVAAPIIAVIVTFLGVVVAVMNFQESLSASKDKEVVLIYSDLISQAADLLYSGGGVTSRKANWVAASRLIFQAEKMISTALYGVYGEIASSKRLGSIIEFRSSTKILESSLPETFFFGSGYQGSSMGHGAYQGVKCSGSEWIHDWSVTIVYKYCLEDLDVMLLDSCEEIASDSRFREKMCTLGQEGASKYLYFRQKFRRINGCIIYKEDQGIKSEAEIDSIVSTGFPYDVE